MCAEMRLAALGSPLQRLAPHPFSRCCSLTVHQTAYMPKTNAVSVCAEWLLPTRAWEEGVVAQFERLREVRRLCDCSFTLPLSCSVTCLRCWLHGYVIV